MEDSPLEYAHRNRDRFVADVKELLRIPSISTLPQHQPDMQRAAEWLQQHLKALGLNSRIITGPGHPLVYGEWLEAAGKPTVLIYGHYDVQPADPLDLWNSAPFEPEQRNGNLYARGASDDKGQTMALVHALESLLQTTGELPVNVKLLIEGEEEAGGATISAYLEEHGKELKADVALVSDSGMFAAGVQTIEAGLRCMVYTEVWVRGATQDLHSGLYGGVAPNPLNALAHIIAGLKDLNGRVTIPGFYDGVQMPERDILDSWRELPFDEASLLKDEIGATALTGEHGFSALERMWARPTLDVHGIMGGFTDPGSKTVIPAEAGAKISMRLVPNQRALHIFELFQKAVQRLAPPGVTISVRLLHTGDPVLIPTDSAFVDVAQQALRETFGCDAVLGRSGGSIPIVGEIKEALGINTVLMGWGLPDDNLHAPNEKLSLENFYAGIDTTVRFLQLLGQMQAEPV
ncbi:MAG: dipeptidase [Chloroflexota bacterium]